MDTFGERVKSRRLELGLSQEKLASLSSLSQSTISDIERGVHHGTTNLARMAAALNVVPKWLESGDGPKEEGDSVPQPAPPALTDDLKDLVSLWKKLRPDQRERFTDEIRRVVADNELTIQALTGVQMQTAKSAASAPLRRVAAVDWHDKERRRSKRR